MQKFLRALFFKSTPKYVRAFCASTPKGHTRKNQSKCRILKPWKIYQNSHFLSLSGSAVGLEFQFMRVQNLRRVGISTQISALDKKNFQFCESYHRNVFNGFYCLIKRDVTRSHFLSKDLNSYHISLFICNVPNEICLFCSIVKLCWFGSSHMVSTLGAEDSNV